MPIYTDLGQLSLASSVLTLGSFDGLHLGHQALIRAVVDRSNKERMPSVVVTFYPHPSVVLRGRKPVFYITLPEEKAARIEALGVEHVVVQRFDDALSHTTASSFLDLLDARLHMRHLCVGEDFALGHEREGNVLFLRKEAERRGFELHVVPPVKVGGEVVSSTRVREGLRSGDVARVASYLGRPFSLRGEVEKGVGRGRSLGIATANLSVHEEQAFPGRGVYACFVRVGQARRAAVANVGLRPTFADSPPAPVVEVHLLDWDGDLYGRSVEVEFVARLREERKFESPEDLVRQIHRDIEVARGLLGPGTEGDDGG
jgi:riboflavin kinase / FMN adenylyltransferase